MEFSYKQTVESGVLKLALIGSIDEDTEFPPVDTDQHKVVEIDLEVIFDVENEVWL